MRGKTEVARKLHESGFNCAQSVLGAFAEDLGVQKETALRLSTGFGSGMGRLCEVCGALTGAFMVVGLRYGRSESDGTKYGPQTERTYALVQELAARFRQRRGSIHCRDLVGHDLSIAAEREKATREGVFTTVCSGCIEEAVGLTEQLMEHAP